MRPENIYQYQRNVSGLYQRKEYAVLGVLGFRSDVVVETVKLDVDGYFPQNVASGSYFSIGAIPGFVEWAAFDLRQTAPLTWTARIARKFGSEYLIPQTDVTLKLSGTPGFFSLTPPTLTITFSGDGLPTVTRIVTYASPYFRSAQAEWDVMATQVHGIFGQSAPVFGPEVTSFDTASNPQRPPSLALETLTIDEVYSRLGVDLQHSPGESIIVPVYLSDSLFGKEEVVVQWDDAELNDLMKVYWSRYKSMAQWAFWTIFVEGLYWDTSVRGVMFDHYDQFNHRGCAVFDDAWSTPPNLVENPNFVPEGYPNRTSHIQRRRFVTACHEMGHCFNLIHSWFSPTASPPWWPLGNEPLALSFMNYPENLTVDDFFKGFAYRFSDLEIQFVRHAPDEMVEMGGSDYPATDDTADRIVAAGGPWKLELSLSRKNALYEFMEPVVVDVRLTNSGDRPQTIDANVFKTGEGLSITIARGDDGLKSALRPWVIRCCATEWKVLQPGESMEYSVFVSADAKGWKIAEPGIYRIRGILNVNGQRVAAPSVRMRVAHPRSWEEEVLAQDYFDSDVASALAMGGTSVMSHANRVLERVGETMPHRPAARHALLTLALPKMSEKKTLEVEGDQGPMRSAGADGARIVVRPAQLDEGKRLLASALRAGEGLDTFGKARLQQLSSIHRVK